jgi:hypothetical protein
MASNCETCGIRKRAEQKPHSLLARLWRWHTNWCPGWKAYQAELARRQAASETGKPTAA